MNTSTVVLLLYGLFLAYFVTLNLSYLALMLVGGFGNRKRSREARLTDMELVETSPLTVPISVMMPAYNEQQGVVDAVRSALRSRFPEFEVIVIDDGSTDGTLAELIRAFDLAPHAPVYEEKVATQPIQSIYYSRREPRLQVIHKANGGKADSLNAGLNLARYRYVFVTDADEIFEPEALARMARVLNFSPGRTVALGPTIRVLNGARVEDGVIVERHLPRRWIERFQMLEYATVFLANRLGWSAMNAVPVVSGGGGAWRRDSLLEVGGFNTTSTHEDMDLTLRMHQHLRAGRKDYDIVYVPDPVIWTEVPHTWLGLFRQRKRWQRTLYESLWECRRMWFNPRYGTVGLLQMPYLLLYEALGPFVELASYVTLLVLWLMGALDSSLWVAFLLLGMGLTSLLRLGSLAMGLVFYEELKAGDIVRLGLASLLEYWIYRPFQLVARVPAFFEFLKGTRSHEKAERKARSRPAASAAAA